MAGSRSRSASMSREDSIHSPQTPSSTLKGFPITSASHAEAPCSATDSTIHTIHTTSRKRSRNDSWSLETPVSAIPSPSPFANMQYRLAGGLDTPTAVTSQYSTYDSATPDVAFRRGRPYVSHERNDYFHELGGNHIRGLPGKDGNGRAPRPIYQPSHNTWGSLVFSLAGKVLNFCTAGTFQGFFSGGGQGYKMDTKTSMLNTTLSRQGVEDSEWLNIPTPASSDLEDESLRAAKKSKTGSDNTWVMVADPRRTRSLHKVQPSLLPRPSSPSTPKSGSPSRQPTSASTAILGRNSKRPTANLQRTMSTRTASSAGLRSVDTKAPPSQSHRRDSSFKSTSNDIHTWRNSHVVTPVSTAQTNIQAPFSAGSTSSHHGVQARGRAESPIAKKTREHMDQVRKSQMAEDVEIMKMNKHLKDLIKQGKEALGTRVEVDFEERNDW